MALQWQTEITKLIEQLSEHGVSQVAFFKSKCLGRRGQGEAESICAIFLVIKYAELAGLELNK